MKNLKIIPILFLLLSFCSCSDDDQSSTMAGLEGEWRLKNISGGIMGTNIDHNDDAIKWTFNTENNTINVVNTTTEDMLYDPLDTGIYTYEFVESDVQELCNERIEIDNSDYGCVTINGNTLIIDQRYADGYALRFERKNQTNQ